MMKIIERDHPTLIIEVDDVDAIRLLQGVGYKMKKLPGFPNRIFSYGGG